MWKPSCRTVPRLGIADAEPGADDAANRHGPARHSRGRLPSAARRRSSCFLQLLRACASSSFSSASVASSPSACRSRICLFVVADARFELALLGGEEDEAGQAEDEGEGDGGGGDVGGRPAALLAAEEVEEGGAGGRVAEGARGAPHRRGQQDQHERDQRQQRGGDEVQAGMLAEQLGRGDSWLAFQFLGRIDVHGHVVVVEVEDDGQGDGGLGRRQHDDEQGEDLPSTSNAGL